MKEIFHQYGSAILAILVGVGLLAVLFGIGFGGKSGVLQIAGIQAKVDSVNFSSYSDFKAVQKVHKRTEPKATYISANGRIFVNKDTDLLSCFTISDYEGTIFFLRDTVLTKANSGLMFCKILDIQDEAGTSYITLYQSGNGHITFQKAGIYYVCFKTRDRENVTGIWKIPIAVDERGPGR